MVESDRIIVDYSGTSPQIPRGVNCVYNYTLAHTVFSIKCALCPDIPNNEGTYKPIILEAPEGSILNAKPPAALVSRHVLSTHINHALFGALAEAIPNRVIAECGGFGTPANIKGIRANGKRFMSMMMDIRSMGASASRDGYAGVSFPSNIAIPSAEITETRVPMTILSREIMTDSGGPGKYRGGCAVRFSMRSENDLPAEIGFSQTWDFPPEGRLGGQSGSPVSRFMNDSPAQADKVTVEMNPGDVLIADSSGGGGFYRPTERDPAKVLEDVIDGYVSLEQAREVYKVVIKSPTTIDWEGTISLRAHG
jgi:N-methylhydantoinase B